MDIQRYKRGQIWWLKDEVKDYTNHIPAGTRPAIIVSNDSANRFSYNLTVVPCTSADKKELPTHIPLEINGPSTALVENITTVSNSIIGGYIGTCDDKLMDKIDEAIQIALGLKAIPDKSKLQVTVQQFEPVQAKIEEKVVNEIKPVKSKGRRPALTEDEKLRFLNDYENHDVEYMLKKYNYKNKKCLHQKVYLIRSELGLGVRNR